MLSGFSKWLENTHDFYYNGWNDLAYGINSWVPHPKYNTPREWVAFLKMKLRTNPPENVQYAKGTLDAIDHYLKYGTIEDRDPGMMN